MMTAVHLTSAEEALGRIPRDWVGPTDPQLGSNLGSYLAVLNCNQAKVVDLDYFLYFLR